MTTDSITGPRDEGSSFSEYFWQVEEIAHRCLTFGHHFRNVSAHPGSGQFWSYVQNALGEGFCLLWCHLFGSRNDGFHYAKLFERAKARGVGDAFAPPAVLERILAATGESAQSYSKLRDEVKRCRDKFVAHREDPAPQVFFPDVDRAGALVRALRLEQERLVDALLSLTPDDSWLLSHRDYYRSHGANDAIARQAETSFDAGLRAAARWLGDRNQRPSR